MGERNVIILQCKTQYIRYFGFPVKHLTPEICVHLISTLSLHKHLYTYKRLPECGHEEFSRHHSISLSVKYVSVS